MKTLLVLLALFLCTIFSLPLDDYVNAPDPTYKWEHVATHQNTGYILYILKLTSQTWLDPSRIDRYVWEHWLRITVPNQLSNSQNAVIYINGGGNPLGNPPSDTEFFLPEVALAVGDIVAELNQIPNQPIVFAGETEGRSEDSFLAKTWDLFIREEDPVLIGRFPMVKAVVKAMDAIQEFVATLNEVPVPRGFLLAGGSKRGWATWLGGAVDTRVIAIAPLVIDVLDMNPNFNEIYQTYGRWPLALSSYTDMNITRCLNCPIFEQLSLHEDPLTYIDRFKTRNVPIFAANACGDEFFIPTSWKYWFEKYTGEKFIRYLPNAEHSLATAIDRIVATFKSFIFTLDNNVARPSYTFKVSDDKSQITVQTVVPPKSVKLWQAYNRFGRAYIVNCYLTCLWRSSPLDDIGNGTYVGRVDVPDNGSRAFLIEVEYDIGFEETFVTSTGVAIVPDVFDHPPCPDNECALCSTC